jgi:hypothetical protein
MNKMDIYDITTSKFDWKYQILSYVYHFYNLNAKIVYIVWILNILNDVENELGKDSQFYFNGTQIVHCFTVNFNLPSISPFTSGYERIVTIF